MKFYLNGPGHIHDQDDRHAHKPLINISRPRSPIETWHVSLGTQVLQSLYKLLQSFNGEKLAAKDYID